jgi:putative SOS response-associated peptidase YedK
MPVILKPDIYALWLDPDYQDIGGLQGIIREGIITDLSSRAVSKQVNSSRYNDPTNIKPLTQIEIDFQ